MVVNLLVRACVQQNALVVVKALVIQRQQGIVGQKAQIPALVAVQMEVTSLREVVILVQALHLEQHLAQLVEKLVAQIVMEVVLVHAELAVLQPVLKGQLENLLLQVVLSHVQVLAIRFVMDALEPVHQVLAEEDAIMAVAHGAEIAVEADVKIVVILIVHLVLVAVVLVVVLALDALDAEEHAHQGAKGVLEIVITHAKMLAALVIVKALAVVDAVQHVQKTVSKDVTLAAQQLVVLIVLEPLHNKGGFLWQI